MKTKGKGLSQLWKRNAVVAAIALFVCAAVYLNWSYEQEAAGKTLGESTLVGKEDPLLGGGADSSSSGAAEGDGQTGEGTQAQEGDQPDRRRLRRLLLHRPPQPAAVPGQCSGPAPGRRRGGRGPGLEG